jgi:hypothetical protein
MAGKSKEVYIKATDAARELVNLKRRNPTGKNVPVFQKALDALLAKLTPEQGAAITAWAEALPE